MHSRRKLIVIGVALSIAVLIGILGRAPIRLAYHKWRLDLESRAAGRVYHHQENRFDRFRESFFRLLHTDWKKWENPNNEVAAQKKVLLEMGYLREVEFPLSNRINFGILISNATKRFGPEWWELGSSPSQTVVSVIAPTNRIVDWQKLIHELDVPRK